MIGWGIIQLQYLGGSTSIFNGSHYSNFAEYETTMILFNHNLIQGYD